jgi:hypothetical protein
MSEPRKMPGGDLIRRAARLTTGTAVAATDVMVMSFEMTGRVARKLLPGRRSPAGGSDQSAPTLDDRPDQGGSADPEGRGGERDR